ncbi:MAG: ATP-binding protein [Phenylobacterium sp.]|uniref:ATP-binding protein n=1 Tax=Phenylobacterium sp. TaxID=1871053 RepID=UPI00391D7EEE
MTRILSDAEKTRLIAELTAARDEAVAQRIAAEAAREEARRAAHAKSTFLATMSHEIRTPMNGVLGMAQLLQRSELTPAQRSHVETLIRSGELLMTVLSDILDLSKIDAGRMELVKGAVDIRALLDEIVAFWEPTAAERGLLLSARMDPELPSHAALDGARVRQILFNLVGNALKFTKAGEVAILARAELAEGAPHLVLEVADTGCGIAADVIPHLFERFTQADDSDVRRFGGTGLGLAICKQLSGLMGGHIDVDSRLGEGSIFHVRLPLEPASAEAVAAPAPLLDGEGPVLSVLAADDNPTNLLVLEHLLSALGWRVCKASGGREALEALTNESFDLVLMDIQMPEMTGIDVLQALRARPGPNRSTPLIAVTADAMTIGGEGYMDLGFAGFVTKPVNVSSLVTAMMAAVANGDDPDAQAAAHA